MLDSWYISEEQKEKKTKAVQKELAGLDVEYMRHSLDGQGLTPDMAKVNGHSIIWHGFAMAEPDKMEVEVYFYDADDAEGHVPIKGLRKRVEK